MTTQAAPDDDDFGRQMAIARQVMKKDRVVLRALALGDEYPELDVAELLAIARTRASHLK